jgi:predicted nucleotidyltransferase
LRFAGCIALALLAALPGCAPGEDPAPPAGPDCASATAAARGFEDVTVELGLARYGGACIAFDDFDGDGRVDLLLGVGEADDPYSSNALWLYPNAGDGTFEPALEILPTALGPLACTVADYDRDGRLDVLVGGVLGRHMLLRNEGGFSFADETAKLPVLPLEGDGIVLAHTFFDYDRDGWLDILIGRFVTTYSPSPDHCHQTVEDFQCVPPTALTTAPPLLLHNERGAGFTLVADAMAAPWASIMHAFIVTDWDGDGWPDVFVSNDFSQNLMFRNAAGSGQFVNVSRQARVDFFNHGMGATAADFDGDGTLDLYSSDLGPPHFVFGGYGVFEDRAAELGMTEWTRYTSSWSPLSGDFDHDGDLDLYVVNSGLVADGEQMMRLAVATPIAPPFPEQADFVFWNEGGGAHWSRELVPHPAGATPSVTFGSSALGDYDGDGDLDVAVCAGRLPMRFRLLRNERAAGHHLTVELRPGKSTPLAETAELSVERGGKRVATQRYGGRQGNLGSSWHAAHFGSCDATPFDAVEVRWPNGHTQRVEGPIALGERLVIEGD